MSTLTIPAAFLAALIAVESGGNDAAIGDNGQAVGCLQIHPGVVIDANAQYREETFAQWDQFTLLSRRDRRTAIEICQLYLARYATKDRLGREPSLEDMARIWNGGPDGYKKTATAPYWVKVRTAMEDGVSVETGNFYTSVMGFYCFASPEGDFFANTP